LADIFVQANTNGRLHSAQEPSLAPLNRGFLYGDAIYEVWRTYGGVLFAWEEHWRRLRAPAAALHLPLPFSPEQILRETQRTVAAYRSASAETGEIYLRLQITRGGGAIGLDPGLADRPDFVLLVQRCPAWPAAKAAAGITLSIATEYRRNPAQTLDPAWKTGNYLNNLLCLREARARGADEVLMLNLAGELTEAAVANIAFVRDGTLITPPLASGLLAGVTRELTLGAVAALAGIGVRETPLRPEDLAGMAECLLLSTTKDVTPVAAIDGVRFSVGPDTATARLKAAFGQYAGGYAAAHPELRLA